MNLERGLMALAVGAEHGVEVLPARLLVRPHVFAGEGVAGNRALRRRVQLGTPTPQPQARVRRFFLRCSSAKFGVCGSPVGNWVSE